MRSLLKGLLKENAISATHGMLTLKVVVRPKTSVGSELGGM